VLAPARAVLAAGAHDLQSHGTSAGGPLPSVRPVVNVAATPAGPATTRISRAGAASNSGPRAHSGDQPVAALSADGLTTLHDLVISRSDGDGLVSLPGFKKTGSRHLSWV